MPGGLINLLSTVAAFGCSFSQKEVTAAGGSACLSWLLFTPHALPDVSYWDQTVDLYLLGEHIKHYTRGFKT